MSVLYLESADALAHLIRFYCPNAPALLDVTYGTGTMARKSPIPVLGVDIDPSSRAQIVADSTNLPLKAGSYQAAVFDPPYLYGSASSHRGPVGAKTWDEKRTTWKKPMDLVLFSEKIAKELGRVLIPGATIFVKIMNSRFKGSLIRNDNVITAAFDLHDQFTLHDQLVYVRTVTGSFTNSRSSQMAHGFWLIFRRK